MQTVMVNVKISATGNYAQPTWYPWATPSFPCGLERRPGKPQTTGRGGLPSIYRTLIFSMHGQLLALLRALSTTKTAGRELRSEECQPRIPPSCSARWRCWRFFGLMCPCLRASGPRSRHVIISDMYRTQIKKKTRESSCDLSGIM